MAEAATQEVTSTETAPPGDAQGQMSERDAISAATGLFFDSKPEEAPAETEEVTEATAEATEEAETEAEAATEDETTETEAEASEATETDETETTGDTFEITTDDGTVQRVPAQEVWAGYEKAQELETQLADARALPKQMLPAEVETAIRGAVEARAQYMGMLDQYLASPAIPEPDISLLDENGVNYDPSEYMRQQANKAKAEANIKAISEERDRIAKEQEEQTRSIAESVKARELNELYKHWPEFKDTGVQKQVRDDLKEHYGLDEETVNSVMDHRFFRLAKDALENKRTRAAAEKAVKVVRAKPKLVKSDASQNRNAKGQYQAEAMAALQKNPTSDEAAAAALSAFLK